MAEKAKLEAQKTAALADKDSAEEMVANITTAIEALTTAKSDYQANVQAAAGRANEAEAEIKKVMKL